MLIAGAVPSTVFFAAFAPHQALSLMFGATVEGPLSELIVRNWGVLIGSVGLILIYGAFKPQVRHLALVVGVATKLAFIGLVLALGTAYLAQAGASIIFDAVVVIVFSLYLATSPSGNEVA